MIVYMTPGNQLASSACCIETPASIEYIIACGIRSKATDCPAITSEMSHIGTYAGIH